jgi:hypothetical protein
VKRKHITTQTHTEKAILTAILRSNARVEQLKQQKLLLRWSQVVLLKHYNYRAMSIQRKKSRFLSFVLLCNLHFTCHCLGCVNCRFCNDDGQHTKKFKFRERELKLSFLPKDNYYEWRKVVWPCILLTPREKKI